MLDELTDLPIYTQSLGLASAEVHRHDGVYSLFLVGDQVACFLGNSNSLEDCQEEIKTLSKLARSYSISGSSILVSLAGQKS